MKQFQHTVRDPRGIHARLAGMISRLAKNYDDTAITVSFNGKNANASALLRLMGLGAKNGSRVTITCDGPSEIEACIAMQNFFQNNL